MGETEAYTKIKLPTIDEVLMAGASAFDLVHLVAELLENATQFSDPPDINLSIDRSIGFIVIGRLARRLRATVDIAPTPGSGVTATVVPSSLIVDGPDSQPKETAVAKVSAVEAPSVGDESTSLTRCWK